MSDEEWDVETFGEEECLFCSFISDSFEANVQHMTISHSFFIPDVEFLVDLPALMQYLGMYSLNLYVQDSEKAFHIMNVVVTWKYA